MSSVSPSPSRARPLHPRPHHLHRPCHPSRCQCSWHPSGCRCPCLPSRDRRAALSSSSFLLLLLLFIRGLLSLHQRRVPESMESAPHNSYRCALPLVEKRTIFRCRRSAKYQSINRLRALMAMLSPCPSVSLNKYGLFTVVSLGPWVWMRWLSNV